MGRYSVQLSNNLPKREILASKVAINNKAKAAKQLVINDA